MKTFVSTMFAATLASAGAVSVSAQVSDTDGDGAFSIEELQAAFPNLSEDVFQIVDVDGNGAVSVEELADAEAAGVLPQG